MKYSVQGIQPLDTLQQADQIRMRTRDWGRVIDYIEKMPEKTYILDWTMEELNKDEIKWELYQAYAEKADIVFCVETISYGQACDEHGLNWYWKYPITTWYDLMGIIELKPSYIFLGAPLSFSLDKVKAITDIPIRLCPNLAYDAYIPRENGICGQWIRPEDQVEYGKYVDVFDFETVDLARERTLLHVYKDNGYWPGNLNLLITNLNVDVDNRTIPDETGAYRTKCEQRCMRNPDGCHFCETAIKFSNVLKEQQQEARKARRQALS